MAGSVPRLSANLGKPSAVLNFVLGFDGSCSRITRSISSMPAWVSSFQQAIGAIGGCQQRFDEGDPRRVAAARLADVRAPAIRVGDGAGGVEDRLVVGP